MAYPRGTSITGAVSLPATLPTAWYYIAFRVWETTRGIEQDLAQIPIAVYAVDGTISSEQVSAREPARLPTTPPDATSGLKINIDETTLPHQTGQAAHISFKVTDLLGRPVEAAVSVSISDWSLLGHPQRWGWITFTLAILCELSYPNGYTAVCFGRG
ncbi:MAG: hypothetical protein R2795_09225 [Saprospiraceae bacterium]